MKSINAYINEMSDNRLAGAKVVVWEEGENFHCTPESNFNDGKPADEDLVFNFPKAHFESADKVKKYLIKFFGKNDKTIILK